ncbi:MAG: hypothetical protein ACLUD2_09180 [Clostridium sp.]
MVAGPFPSCVRKTLLVGFIGDERRESELAAKADDRGRHSGTRFSCGSRAALESIFFMQTAQTHNKGKW